MFIVETLVLDDGSVFPRYGKDPYGKTVEDHHKHTYFGVRKVAAIIPHPSATNKLDAKIKREFLRRSFKQMGIKVTKKG